MGVPFLFCMVLYYYFVIDNNETVAEDFTGTVVPEVATEVAYDYTIPMLIFTALGVLSILFAFLLKRENTIKGYGLELPNIQK